MKTSRFKHSYQTNASKLHRKIGDILRAEDGLFSGFRSYQEYPVNKILKTYPDGRHKFDWVILDLKLVIEAHGRQHYEVTNWGSIDTEEAIDRFRDGRERDHMKETAALEAGFTYITIPYWDYKKIDQEYIWQKYKECFNSEVQPLEKRNEPTLYETALKEKAKAYRKADYRRKKEWLKRIKGGITDDS